jgi:raffinose/stachyose/melibiose transport system permease protein
LQNISQYRVEPGKKRRGGSSYLNQPLVIVMFLLPAAILFLTFVLFPIVQAAYISLFKWNGLGPIEDFIGAKNFIRMFEHEPFRQALVHVLIIIVLSITLQLPLALGLAILIGRKLPGRAFFRTIFFLPYIISEAITAVLWSFIFNPRFAASDVINSLLDTLLPFFKPVLARTIYLSIYMSVLGSIQQFDLVWLMTEGGPVNASEVLTTYMYRHGFVSFRLGYGSSVAVVLFLICLVFSLVYQGVFMRREYAGRAD